MTAALSMGAMEYRGTGIDLRGPSLIVGLGVTGLSVARFLRRQGHELRVVDSRERPPGLAALRAEQPDVELHLGPFEPTALDGMRRLVLSPGLSVDLPLVAAARAHGIPVINDVEIFAHLAPAPIIAVTGSNGKSTVVTLVERFAAAAGKHVPAGGNLGTAALDLLAVTDAEAFVLEISSFQMEACDSLRPIAAAVLNVSPDHLDRHRDLAHYASLKAKLIEHAELAVLNRDDPIVARMGARHPRIVEFAVNERLPHGYSLTSEHGRRSIARDGVPLIPTSEVAMHGDHNLGNAMAALALAAAIGVATEPALEVLRTFGGLPHRCEAVAERRGVRYINDSKATNVGATIAALSGLRGPIVLIAGGDGKGADFTQLREHLRGKVRAMLVIGRSAEALVEALATECPVTRCASLEEAVDAAAAIAVDGDTVLLAPACSSLDMFADYRARGDAFKAAVASLGP